MLFPRQINIQASKKSIKTILKPWYFMDCLMHCGAKKDERTELNNSTYTSEGS